MRQPVVFTVSLIDQIRVFVISVGGLGIGFHMLMLGVWLGYAVIGVGLYMGYHYLFNQIYMIKIDEVVLEIKYLFSSKIIHKDDIRDIAFRKASRSLTGNGAAIILHIGSSDLKLQSSLRLQEQGRFSKRTPLNVLHDTLSKTLRLIMQVTRGATCCALHF